MRAFREMRSVGRRMTAMTLVAMMSVAPALAAPGVTTADVKFRSGPGTNYPSTEGLASGSKVDIGECDAGGAWCAVTANGRRGFVSGRYLKATDEPDAWPRAFDVGEGRLILYQPQFTSWTDFRTIEALVAAEYQASPQAKPAFGVIGLRGMTSFDDDAGSVVIADVAVTQLNFSGLARDELAALSLDTDKLLPTGPITLSEKRIAASLAEQQRANDVQGLKADPPPIAVSTKPAILLQTDGDPVFAPVKGRAGLFFVVNTNWDLFRIEETGPLLLRDDTHWLTAQAMQGPWTPVNELPPLLKDLPDDESWKDARSAIPPETYARGAAPQVIVTAKPAELLLFMGEPDLVDVRGTALQWASNSESDVFYDRNGKLWYVLLSGRWFRSPSLDGPWSFATPDLPRDFRNISQDVPYQAVRASVPGTPESAEARLRSSIPTTARVQMGSITPDVTFTGDAQFERIEGTKLSYATNTSATVIQAGGRYFLLQDGVWFVADSPEGPWQIAREIAQEIYDIPPSSPVYNATYVRVYETEPEAVWFGYTAGYLFGFLAWGTFVYGTGWAYPPYWYRWPGYGYPIYYPRPTTWGVGAYYNPARGVYGRYGYAYGPYRGIAAGRTWNPRTGTYTRAGAAWGPRGVAGFIGAYNPRSDRGGFVAGGRGVYGSWKSAGVTRGSEWARVSARTNAAGNSSLRWNTSNGQGFVREGRRGDIYAGRDGNVYRNIGDGWQKFDGGWQDVSRPESKDLLDREGARNLGPEARERLQERGGGESLRNMAGVAAGGAAGAALGQRLNRSGEAGRAERPGTDDTRERRAERDTGPRTDRSPGRPGQRPAAASQRPAQGAGSARPRPSPTLPAHLSRDAQGRHVGNQRQMAARSFDRHVSPQFSRGGGLAASRPMPRPSYGGGGFGGGRGGFGGGGGRGGRR